MNHVSAGSILSFMMAVIVAARPALGASPRPPKQLSACTVCHDISTERKTLIGPPLFGMAGATPSIEVPFKQWDEVALDQWLSDPGKLKPGTSMSYRVEDPKKRAEIIQALLTLK